MQGLIGIPGIKGEYSFSGPQGETGAMGKCTNNRFSFFIYVFTRVAIIILIFRSNR